MSRQGEPDEPVSPVSSLGPRGTESHARHRAHAAGRHLPAARWPGAPSRCRGHPGAGRATL